MLTRLLRRLLFWLIGVPFGLALTLFAVANRQPVDVGLWPLPWTLQLPLYVQVLGGVGVGLIAGVCLSWIGSAGLRARARASRRRTRELEREVTRLRLHQQDATPAEAPALPRPAAEQASLLPGMIS
ncbi:lipopolysaccharide assembly protein LapA domain-containing protein [Novispirillum itersonii]|uniref:Putative integral membrane protein n=1 Tax=Novispirillum itersonii TaxID=189 RepID=A0A7W9ZED1_NOVIT|nr:lipopolysaccharide assembly protein LapA domain-containing protein [Novispirillum itersonii]MBB6209052.1 putative integral membrane protein [Novispirillum itersonii]